MLLEFQKAQQAFANRIRHGNNAPCPKGITNGRMEIYQQCFFNGINALLTNCFPVIHSILRRDQWRGLVRDFYANHQSKTPLFYEIPEEFLSYLLQEHKGIDGFGFLIELAHFEWMALALNNASGNPPKALAKKADYDCSILAVSEVAEIVGYHFPVHRITPKYLPIKQAGTATYLCIYRHSDDRVKHIELNAVTARFLQILKASPQSTKSAIEEVAKEMGHQDIDTFWTSNNDIINYLIKQGVLYIQDIGHGSTA